MKKTRRFLALVLTVITLMSVMAVTAFAASNHEDNPISSFSINFFGFKQLDPDTKLNSTPLYLYITNGSRTTVQVTARGCDSLGENPADLTIANKTLVDYVTCKVGEKYLIQSLINERGYTYCTLGIKSPNVLGDTVKGYWSPDSVGEYQYAT